MGKTFAFIANLNWRFMNNKNLLWVKILGKKYKKTNHNLRLTKSHSYHSYIWKSIVKTFPLFYNGISWNINNGDNIHPWEDQWIEASHSLREVIQGPLNKHDLYLTVSRILSNEVWDFSGHCYSRWNDNRRSMFRGRLVELLTY
ncbi:hypothetical protein RDI58_007061 [Solanum bulbocastanum]|uniref:Uncharacterized protein n=1 Tax=Solanum bulbocastanum TaxID=147425 RepID=A0AAN8TS40_SOLBU